MFTDDARVDYSAAGLVVGTCDEAVEYLGPPPGGRSPSACTTSRTWKAGSTATARSSIAMWFNAVALAGSRTGITFFAGAGTTSSSGRRRAGVSSNLRLEVVAVTDAQQLSDELEIRALLSRYARAVDTKDWDLYRSVFTDDAHIDYSSAGAAVGSRDEVADWLAAGFAAIPWTHALHHERRDAISPATPPRCGRCSTTRCNCPAWPKQSCCGGYYHHELVRTPDGWRSRSLREDNVWFVNAPAGG